MDPKRVENRSGGWVDSPDEGLNFVGPARMQITIRVPRAGRYEIWMKGDAGDKTDMLMDEAVKAAALTRTVLAEAVKEAAEFKEQRKAEEAGTKKKGKDVEMTG